MRFLLGSLLLFSFSAVHAAQITKTTFAFPGRVEIHVQPELSELDVLFVVDDSGSMQEHQQNLIKNIPELAKAALKNGVHVHAGVTTTSQDCSNYGKVCNGKFNGSMVDSKSPDFLTKLATNLDVGTNGNPEETPFDMAIAAMTEPVAKVDHPDFYRPRAHFALIFLTDADDQSRIYTPESFAAFFQGLKNESNKVTVASIQNTSERGCSSEPYGPKLTTAVNLMKGKIQNICSADYGTQLGEIGSDIVRKVTREIPLTIAPDVASLTVTFGSAILEKGDLHHGWIYNSVTNTVVLGDMIDWGSLSGDELVVSFVPKDWK
jgi:hypothetical protein